MTAGARAGGDEDPPPKGGGPTADRTRPPGDPGIDAGAQPRTRAGFVALAGRPNVGKSTLLNHVVGTKVAIVSPKPQTTRRAIRGIATGPSWQLVLVDLPGSQRPRDALTQRMQRRTERELRESDAALLVLNGEQAVGPGDRFIAAAVTAAEVPCVVAVNKVDALDRPRTAAALSAAVELELPPEAEIYPISARAAVPTARIVRPPAPTTMPFCDSVSTHTRAATTSAPPGRSSISSTSTSTACGSSCRVRASTCSRTSSARRTSSERSSVSSGG